jgi:putative membrane protein
MNDHTSWERLHPLSPIVRGGRRTIALVVVLAPSLLAGRGSRVTLVEFGIVVLLVGFGFVSWFLTRWRIDGGDLRIESGVLRRHSLRFPLSQVQAVDIVRPGLSRLLGVAELRLRMGGASGASGRLAYLGAAEVEPLRAFILKAALGSAAGEEGAQAAAEPTHEHVLARVPPGRLIGSILISDVGLLAAAVLVAIAVGAVLAPTAAAALASGGGGVWALSVLTLLWRRFNQEYNFTVAEAPDGLRLNGGLVALTAETIRPGRVQAARLVEPFLWRRVGWCRLEVDLAGRQRDKGESRGARGALHTVLPVGSRALADQLLARIVPDRPLPQLPPPRRVRWKSPLRYRMLAWGRSETCVATRSGRIQRVTYWVPLEKVQSLRQVQGPWQRLLRLGTIHIDTAGSRKMHAALRDRDSAEAERTLAELTLLARRARRPPAARPNPTAPTVAPAGL